MDKTSPRSLRLLIVLSVFICTFSFLQMGISTPPFAPSLPSVIKYCVFVFTLLNHENETFATIRPIDVSHARRAWEPCKHLSTRQRVLAWEMESIQIQANNTDYKIFKPR